jgi:predicted nucleic acid-binding protein
LGRRRRLLARSGWARAIAPHTHDVQIADALIAATARVHDARLMTGDAAQFPMLNDLVVPYWLN